MIKNTLKYNKTTLPKNLGDTYYLKYWKDFRITP